MITEGLSAWINIENGAIMLTYKFNQLKRAIAVFGKLNTFLGYAAILCAVVYLVLFSPISVKTISSKSQVSIETEILKNNLYKHKVANSFVYSVNSNISLRTEVQRLFIPSIDVETQIFDGEENSSLEKGAWIMPYYSFPDQKVESYPIVIAAHRWGEDGLSYEFRRKKLFLNLPLVTEGNEVRIEWNNKIHTYSIFRIEESEYVTTLADLVLITCKYYNSPERYFVYANQV